MRAIEDVSRDLAAAKAEENRQYWAFTRTARGKPVDPAVCRRVVELEEELAAIRREAVAVPAVTSRRMVHKGHDNNALANFKSKQARAAKRMGKGRRSRVLCRYDGGNVRPSFQDL